MNFTFNEIKKEIIRVFEENGKKKMEGIVYYDATLNSFLWCGDLRSVVLTMQNTKIGSVKYFKITKRDGLKVE